MSASLNAFQLLIKPAGPDCNQDCAYCFYKRVADVFPESKTHRMSPVILEELIKQYMNLNFSMSVFGWQGGEPTLCGISFFKNVVNLQMKYGKSGQRVGNSLQTNGTLLNSDWCKFLKEYKFFVGLSLDGPMYIHDKYRRLNGKGSWEKVMKAAKMLSDYGIEFNILSMVTDKSQKLAGELFTWFLENGFRYLQFIPCMEKDSTGKIAPFSATPREYGDFLCELFDLWWEKRETGISIRTFDGIIEGLIYGKSPTLCVFGDSCQSYLVVEHDGSVYPCDFFVRRDMKLGNIMDDRIDSIYQSAKYKMFGRGKTSLPDECLHCSWFKLCHGGCQKDRIDLHSRTYFCESYKHFMNHSIKKLDQIAGEIKKRIRKGN